MVPILLYHEQAYAPRDQASPGKSRYQVAGWNDLLHEHEDRQCGDPQHVHDAADEEKNHQRQQQPTQKVP